MSSTDSNVAILDRESGGSPGCVFTICNLKYLPQALVAISTFSEFHSADEQSIVVMDLEECTEIQGIKLLSMETIIEGTNHLMEGESSEVFKYYDITSACTAIKPLALLYFRASFPSHNFFTYVDPDTFWLGALDNKFINNNLYFYRHRYDLGRADGYSGYNFLTFGGVNLGLFVDTGSSIENIIAWHRFALRINFESSMLGYYTDQKPADLLVISQRAFSIYDERTNLSYWNIADVKLTYINNKFFVEQINKSRPLIMFHFSGYRKNIVEYASERKEQYFSSSSVNEISIIHNIYTEAVEERRILLKSSPLVKNNIGTAEHHEIFRYLYKSKFGGSHYLLHKLINLLFRFDFFSIAISRFYKIKNPLKI
jgi:hypothetical protein